MKRILLITAAALVLSACADTSHNPVEPGAPSFSSGQRWQIFGFGTPAQTVSASPGYEVATRFYATTPGCIRKLHFYKAVGETGTNYVTVWTNSGTALYTDRIADSFNGSGWRTLDLQPLLGPPIDSSVCISANTYYRVSVNTNTYQAKTGGFFDNGAITNGALVADYSYYGTAGYFPTTGSGSGYFIDVTFEED
ncbi:DUF4082 domain-containing protein [Longimicrobium sp.]|uniref:DUF4082 domain-containing protein n=1 Tax=Longimicrobium sp. TaxID=2029185 RepID=UPI003B3B5ECF